MLAAISEITTSIFWSKKLIIFLDIFSSVKSPFKKFTFFISSISIISTAKTLPLIIFFITTCDHPPGLDPKSSKEV